MNQLGLPQHLHPESIFFKITFQLFQVVNVFAFHMTSPSVLSRILARSISLRQSALFSKNKVWKGGKTHMVWWENRGNSAFQARQSCR